MLSVLSETQRAIVEVMTMRLHVPQALEYLKDAGHEMSRAKYFRQRKKIENMKLERMHYIAKYFPDQHLERIDKCELVEKLCWENYHTEKDPMKKVKILDSIIAIQPYLSGYYETTKYILESRVNNDTELESTVFDVSDVTSNIPKSLRPSPLPKSLMRLPPIEEVEAWTDNNNDAGDKQTNKSEIKPRVTSYQDKDKEESEKEGGEGWKLLNCPTCQKSFYNNFTLSAHQCKLT